MFLWSGVAVSAPFAAPRPRRPPHGLLMCRIRSIRRWLQLVTATLRSIRGSTTEATEATETAPGVGHPPRLASSPMRVPGPEQARHASVAVRGPPWFIGRPGRRRSRAGSTVARRVHASGGLQRPCCSDQLKPPPNPADPATLVVEAGSALVSTGGATRGVALPDAPGATAPAASRPRHCRGARRG